MGRKQDVDLNLTVNFKERLQKIGVPRDFNSAW